MEAAVMGDERRLLEDGATDFEAALLRAGRRDGPSSASRRRIVAGVAAGALVPAALTWSAGASAVGWLQRAVRSTAVRVGLGGTVGAAAIWGGVTLSQSESESAAPPPASRPAATAMAPVLAPLAQVPAPELNAPEPNAPAPADDRATTPEQSNARRTVPDPSPLTEELAHLERARSALVRGEPRRSLRLLDEYSRRFAKPRLSSEATVLRIEALVASGERARAAQLGQQFLASHPNGPYERRIRSLIESKERAKKGS